MFVDRDGNGLITGLYTGAQFPGQEFVPGAQIEILPSVAAQRQIETLERSQMLPRISREFMLGVIEAQFPVELREQSFAYVTLKAFDDQIAALRTLL